MTDPKAQEDGKDYSLGESYVAGLSRKPGPTEGIPCDLAWVFWGEKVTTLEAQLQTANKALEEIAYTGDGCRIVGTSRNAAIRNFERVIRIARRALGKE